MNNFPRDGASVKPHLLSTNHRRSQVLRFASNNIKRWPLLVGASLILPCQQKFEQLSKGTRYLLGIGFVLETSFKELRDSVSSTFEDDELETSSSGSCRNTIYIHQCVRSGSRGGEMEGIPRPDVRTSSATSQQTSSEAPLHPIPWSSPASGVWEVRKPK